jgi:hypothetical protein
MLPRRPSADLPSDTSAMPLRRNGIGPSSGRLQASSLMPGVRPTVAFQLSKGSFDRMRTVTIALVVAASVSTRR